MKTFIEAFSTLLRLVLTLLLIWEQSAWAAAPSVLTYQGRLKEAGLPVQGARTVKVELCTLPAGGVCHEAANQAVAVSSGLFHVNFTVPAAADLGSGVWYVQISVGGTALTPRELLTSSAYAVYASTAGTVVDGAIDSAKLAAGAVETAKLATDAVTTAAILSGAVTDPKIASMSASKLTGALPALDGSALTGVTATGIQDGAVNSAKLASDAGSLLKVTGGIMAIDSGLIGIGTTSPAAGTELHIKSTSSNGDLKIESSDQTAVVVSAVNGSYGNIQTSQGGTNGGPLALQQAGGSVGIGTVNPAAKLDVQGGGGIRIQYGLTASTASLTGTGNTLFSLQTSSGIQVAAGGVYASFFAGDGRSLSGVVATSIADGAVDSDKLAAGAVTSSKIGALAVDSSKLSANSVDNEKLVNGAVDSWKIAADSIQALHLGAGAVETAKLAADAVTTAAILSGAVTDSKIASMSASKLTGALPALDGSALTGVTATGIQDGAVDSSKLASSAVTNAKLASGVVDSIKLASDFTSLARVSGGLLAIPSSDTGKLGVGTASPAADLHLLAPTPELYIQDSAGSVGVLAFKNNVNSSLLQIDYQGGSARLIDWVTNSKLEFLTTGLSGTQTRMTLTGDGKVGIGTGLPSAKLDVQGADGVNVQYGVSAATASFTATGDATFSLLTSSGIQVAAGGVYAPFFAGDGRSLTGVVATSIADGAVDSSKLASNAVTASKIAALSVDSSKLALGSVWADQLAAGAVDSAKLASNAVTNAKLAANAVDCTKLASDPNSLAVVSGGLLAIPAADTGKVGLGTLNASYLLHLVKNSNTLDTTQNPTLRIENTNPTPSTGGDANIANLVLSAGNGAITGALSVIHGTAVDGSVYDNNLLLAAKIGYPIDFAPSGTRSVRLSVDGRVGLGTTSPVQKLDVNGKIRLSDDAVAASAGAMRWTGTNFEGYDGAAWKALDVQAPSGGGWTEDVGNNWIYTTTGGRLVGIGNGSPTEMLDLSGAMVFRGMGAPGLSAAGQGKLFFNSGTNKLQISENGGGFTNLIGGAGGAVTLQATTPGAQDTGHLNLSGTGLFGGRLGVGTAVVDSAKLTVLGAGSDMVAFKATGAHIGDATLGNSSAIVGAGASATGAGGAKTVGASGLGGGTANDGTAQVSVGVYGRAGAASDVNDVTAGVYGEGTAGGLGKTYAGYFVSGDVFMGGNLGLGLATPSAKLDVSGTAKATAFQGDGSGLTNLSGANLAAASVDSGKLADGAVGNTKLADGSVTAAKLAAGAIDSSKIAAGAIDSARLADGAVTASKLAAGAIDSLKLASDTGSLAKVSGGLMAVDSSKVGIGTTSPMMKLEVKTASSLDGMRITGSNSGVYPALQFYNGSAFTFTFEGSLMNLRPGFTGDTPALTIAKTNGHIGVGVGTTVPDNGTLVVRSTSTTALNPVLNVQANSGVELMRVQQNGNVGIGTTSPSNELTILGTGADALRQIYLARDTTAGGRSGLSMTETTGGGVTPVGQGNVYYDHDTDTLTLDTDNNDRGIRINGSYIHMMPKDGKVGIGTTNPSQALSIAGALGVIETGALPQYYTALQGGDQAGNIAYTLPTASSNGVLRNTGGVWSWDSGVVTQAYQTAQEEGSGLTQRSVLNFVGSGLTAADNVGSGRTDVTLDATLNALSQYNTNGLLVQTAADTFAGRSLTGPAAGITITNGSGVSGNPTLALANDLAAVEALATTGGVKRTAADAWGTYALTAAGEALLDDADAAAQRTTLGLVSGGAGSVWVEKAGDAMTGQLTLLDGSSMTVTGALGVGASALTAGTLVVRSTSTTALNPVLNVQSNGGTELLRVQQNGYVGIGTTNPAQMLEVVGTVRATAFQGDGSALSVGTASNLAGGAVGSLPYQSGIGATSMLTAGTAGSLLRSNGTAPVWSAAAYPNTVLQGGLLYGSAANTVSQLATANNGVLVTNGSGVPAIGADLPSAVTIGGSYVYRAGGTDVAVADGGTGADLSAVATGGLVYKSGAATLGGTSALSGVLKGNGAAAPTAMTGTASFNTYWSDANTIAAEQYTALMRGGTGADLSGLATGGLLYKGATALTGTGALTGVLKGNGAGAPTAMTGTTNRVARWSDVNTIASGVIYDNGSSVGIGWANPLAKLSFGQSIGTDLIHLFHDAAAGHMGFGIQSSEMQSFIPASAHFSFNSGGGVQPSGTNELMRITGAGSVGIGNTSPTAPLEVGNHSSSRGYLLLNDDGTNPPMVGFDDNRTSGRAYGIYSGHPTAGMFSIYDNDGGGVRLTISNTGNVGIGNTSPGAKLDVNGWMASDTAGGGTPAALLLKLSGAEKGGLGYVGTSNQWSSDSIAGDVVLRTTGGKLMFNTNGGGASSMVISGSGNVGVGTTSPGAKLEVAGQVKIVDGAQGTGKVLTSDGNGLASWQTSAGVPTGAVMFFNLAVCPAGWTELTSARGRYLVGLPSAGTLAGTAGTALTDLENRPVGQHSHPITDPGHYHTWGDDTASGSGSTHGGGGAPPVTTNTSTNPTGITINNSGSVAGTNAPYVQLLVCQKS